MTLSFILLYLYIELNLFKRHVYCRVNTASPNSLYRYGFFFFLAYVKVVTILRCNIWWVNEQIRNHQVRRISVEDPHIIEHRGFEPLCLHLLSLQTEYILYKQDYDIRPDPACMLCYIMYLYFFFYILRQKMYNL